LIHKTAIIDKDAKIEESVEIGPYTIIGGNVKIGKNTKIGPHSFLENCEIGENCKISNSVSIGNEPQDLRFKGNLTKVIIGNNCIIREFTTIHRGSHTDLTRLGDNCYIMAYSHIAHDCIVGNDVIMANCATLAGHVTVEDGAILGGLVAVHQFCRIGKLAMIGGGAMVSKDVPPFTIASGDRARLYGINVVGLKRRGFDNTKIRNIQRAYRLLFESKLIFSDAFQILQDIHADENLGPDIQHFIDFIKLSKRGICHSAHKKLKFREID